MNKDRVKGSFKKFEGAIKEVAWKIVGDKEIEAKGKAEQIEGAAQNAVGVLKDSVKK